MRIDLDTDDPYISSHESNQIQEESHNKVSLIYAYPLYHILELESN